MTFFTAVFGELTFVFLCLVRKLLKCFQICSLFVWASVDFQGWLCSRVEEVDNPCPPSLPLSAFRAQFRKDRGIRYEGKTLTYTQPLPPKPLLPSLAASSNFGHCSLSPFCSEPAGIEFSCCQGGEVFCLPPSEKIELCLHGWGALSCLCLLTSTEHRVVLLYL